MHEFNVFNECVTNQPTDRPTEREDASNKAGYTAQDAPSTRLKITGDGRMDGRTDGHNLL